MINQTGAPGAPIPNVFKKFRKMFGYATNIRKIVNLAERRIFCKRQFGSKALCSQVILLQKVEILKNLQFGIFLHIYRIYISTKFCRNMLCFCAIKKMTHLYSQKERLIFYFPDLSLLQRKDDKMLQRNLWRSQYMCRCTHMIFQNNLRFQNMFFEFLDEGLPWV